MRTCPEHEREDWHDNIVCPACGYVDEEHTDYPSCPDVDGAMAGYTCGGCGKEFRVVVSVAYEYRSVKTSHNPGGTKPC